MLEWCLTCAVGDTCPYRDRQDEAATALCDLRIAEEHERRRQDHYRDWIVYLDESGFDFEL